MNRHLFRDGSQGSVDLMLDACTRCGKCVEVCPSVRPAGIADASPKDIISGVLDILRTGQGHEASRKWAASCMLNGDCIKACDYGVNPRFLLAMARVRDGEGRERAAPAAPPGRREIPRSQPGCDGAFPFAARRRSVGAARPKIGFVIQAG